MTVQLGDVLGASVEMQHVRRWIERVAPLQAPVLLLGETGTGKDLVAQLLASYGARAGQPYVPINCGALGQDLVESELFGHERGAFTGAVQRKLGAFETAAGGTLLLDEIGELPLTLQAKLLRTLESGEVRRVGSCIAQHVPVRVIAATHRNLVTEVQRGTFRADLFHRLHVLVLELPPLRHRLNDLPELVRHFLRVEGCGHYELSEGAAAKLVQYHWPGNIRELRHVLQRALLHSPEGRIEADAIEFATLHGHQVAERTLEALEREAIVTALERYRGNRSRAAAALGMSRSTLHRRLHELGLTARRDVSL